MPTTPKIAPQVYLTAANLRARYNRTDMTIHRWLRDAEMNFPRPYYFGRYRHWRIDELEAWEEEQARKPNGRYCRTVGEPEAA